MPLTKQEIQELRKELETAYRPLFLFDDDADGLSSFLLFYKQVKEGKGIPVKTKPDLSEIFANKVEQFSADKVFILDVPKVSDEFIEKCKTKVIWLDHHQPTKHPKIHYYNPRMHDINDGRPTSYWCYKITKNNMLLAMIGCIGDWFLPDFTNKFKKKYPKLMPKSIKKAEDALFKAKIGKLSQIFSFILKGDNKSTMQCIKILARMDNYEDLLTEKTAEARFVMKKYKRIDKKYKELISTITKKNIEKNIVLFTYDVNQMSFTSELSNELLYKYPDKVIIIGRETSGEMKLSIRSNKYILPPIIEKALTDLQGYGGGHEHACGGCVKTKDFEKFLDNLKKEL